MEKLEKLLVSNLLWKIITTIMAFIYILNIIPTWFGTKKLWLTRGGDGLLFRVLWLIVGVIFWIPGIIISLKFVWFDN